MTIPELLLPSTIPLHPQCPFLPHHKKVRYFEGLNWAHVDHVISILYRNFYVYNIQKYFVTERLHHGLHGPNLAPRNTALFYEEEEEDIEDEDDIVDDDDDSGMVMNADSTGDPEIKVD